MTGAILYPTAGVRKAIERTQTDPDLSPAARVRALETIRDEAHALLGQAEAALGDAKAEASAASADAARVLARAREDADIREELVRRGVATPTELDAAGVPSHEQLDDREADGSLLEHLEELREAFWREWLYRRASLPGHEGEFAAKPGSLPAPRTRAGGKVPSPPKPPKPPAPKAPEAPKPPAAPSPGRVEVPAEAAAHVGPELGHVRTELNDQVLGEGVRDTLDKHTRVGEDGVRRYTPERRELHRQWIAEALAGHEEGRSDPEILFTAGGPASGKSSIIEPNKETGEPPPVPQPEDAVHLDQDIFKKKMPEYQQLAGVDEGGERIEGQEPDPYASDAVHREASDLYRAALAEAQRRRMNLIAEGTGDSGEGQFVGRVRDAKAAGYRTRVIYASAPTSVAEERARYRAEKEGRAVPLAGLRAMHANVSRRFAELLGARDAVDEMTLWDTRENAWEGGQPHLMAHWGYGAQTPGRVDVEPDQLPAVHVPDDALYQQFLGKADEDPGTLIALPTFV